MIMNSQILLIYIVKTVIVSGLFWLYYILALRNKKFHYYNRIYLLSSSILSLAIPLLQFNWFTVEEPVINNDPSKLFYLAVALKNVKTVNSFGWQDWTFVSIGCICLMFLLVLFVQIAKIYRIKKRNPVTVMEGIDLIITEYDHAPFSFLNNLFWKNSISLEEESGKQIFKHELTHIQQRHTWDRLYCQIVCSIFWINPFHWLIHKELQTIHEFMADEAAVENTDTASFAVMLLEAHYGSQFLNPSHSFYYSSIKRRLIMLTTSKNTKYSYFRRVMVLPVILLAIGILSVQVHARERIIEKVNEIKTTINNKILTEDKIKNNDSTPPSVADTSKKPLYVIDGKIVREKALKDLDQSKITSINVLKDEQAIKEYGDAGKNGVVKIYILTKDTLKHTYNSDQKMGVIVPDHPTAPVPVTTPNPPNPPSQDEILKTVDEALKAVDLDKVVHDALVSVNISKTVNDALQSVDIDKIVREALKSADISKNVNEALKSADISGQLKAALAEVAEASKDAEKAMKKASSSEELKQALKAQQKELKKIQKKIEKLKEKEESSTKQSDNPNQ